jgi:hypothetical protein
MNSAGGEDSDQNDSEMTERLRKYNQEGKKKGWMDLCYEQ